MAHNHKYFANVELTGNGTRSVLIADNVDPRIPWLYGLQLDFRFK